MLFLEPRVLCFNSPLQLHPDLPIRSLRSLPIALPRSLAPSRRTLRQGLSHAAGPCQQRRD